MHLKALLSEAQTQVGAQEAEIILLESLGQRDRSYLLSHDQDVVSVPVLIKVRNILRCRQQGIPLAYILGRWDFYDLTLSINHHCLIPRPDTELLVDVVLEKVAPLTSPLCLDLGAGSGAIILAIKKHHARLIAFGLDCSQKALAVAQQNSRDLQLSVQWLQGDWASAFGDETLDCIVCNPPYIAHQELSLMNAETSLEPAGALFSVAQGMADFEVIIQQAAQVLKPGGWLCLEHGFAQSSTVSLLLVQHGFNAVETVQDYSGHDRVTLAQKPILLAGYEGLHVI